MKREPTPELEETTTSDFFAKSNKPKRTEPVKKAAEKPVETPKATPKKAGGRASNNGTPATNGRTSGRAKKSVTSYAERDNDDEFNDDDLDNADDIFGNYYKGKVKDDYIEGGDSDEDLPVKLPHRGTPKAPAKQQKKIKDEDDFEPEEDVDMKDLDAEDDFVEPEEEERAVKSTPKKTTAGRKRKSPEPEEVDSEEEKPKKSRAKKAAPAKSPAKKKVKTEDVAESAAIQAIYDSIPTVRAPTPPPQDPDHKFDWRANAGRSEPAPLGGGGNEMPSGSETCLAGLNFVFTGVLQKWGRTEAQEDA